jgi:hypothetical protein
MTRVAKDKEMISTRLVMARLVAMPHKPHVGKSVVSRKKKVTAPRSRKAATQESND